MTALGLNVEPIWLSEHYWPGVAAELVLAQSGRLSRVGRVAWMGSVVVPGQQSALGLFGASDADDVRRSLALVGVPTEQISAGWHLSGARSVCPCQGTRSGSVRVPIKQQEE